MSEASTIGRKIWSLCDVLRDDGVSYGAYLEQLTYLIFLKMDDEQTKPPIKKLSKIPKQYNWQSLTGKEGSELEDHYRTILTKLGKQKGMLGTIFKKAQNKVSDPEKLKRIIDIINKENWRSLTIDVKGTIYEDLLERNAADVKTGAGQYFTPRSLIKAIVEVMRPKPGITIFDPACGTGGFILSAYDYISKKYGSKMDEDEKKALKYDTFRGWDIVNEVVRLCTMNLFLHGIGEDKELVTVADSLLSEPSEHCKMVMTNPPFGKKSSYVIFNDEGEASKETISYSRQDFVTTTSNKQLNFLQHVKSLLEVDGTAVIVVPDNVLFEGGAGETVRKRLLQECDVHTLLRLPTGIFYSQGVKANVLFFDAKPASPDPWTEKLWIYDFRTNQHFTLKEKPLQYEHLKDFITCYNPENRLNRKEKDNFKPFTYEDLLKRDKVNLDITLLKDESLEDIENLPPPDIIAQEIADNLESALDSVNELIVSLGKK